MTPLRVSILASIAALILLLVVLELIRSRRLQERYALLWLLTCVVVLFFSLWRDALGRFSDLIGIAYPPSALFLLASGFILVLLLHYSTVILRARGAEPAARATPRAPGAKAAGDGSKEASRDLWRVAGEAEASAPA
jgi:hypothetical protein